jgi:type I restriction enzyme, R subunit
VRHLPTLEEAPLRPAQVEAIHNVERSLAQQRFDRSLVQMATGAGRTYAAVTLAYRLLKFGGFARVLFLVDRNNLGDQTLAGFTRRGIEVYGRC